MEVDLVTLTLPEFDGLSAISPRGRRIIEDAHVQLANLASKHRKAPYEYGKWFIKIRDVMLEEGQTEGCAAYCRRMGINHPQFSDCIRIYEAFRSHPKLLHMFPIWVQVQLSRNSLSAVLDEAIELAMNTNQEITREWVEERMGVAQKKMPPPDDDLDDDEDRDVDRYLNGDDDDEEEDEKDVIPIDRRKEFNDALLANTMAIEDPSEARDKLCKILIEDAQFMKKRISTFVHERKIWGGTWYPKLERAIDMLSEGIQELQATQIVHTGE